MTTHSAEHTVVVNAKPGDVYQLVADVAGWFRLFEPTVHVEHLSRTSDEERFRIWATANGGVMTWTSRRELDRDAGRVRFWQEVSQPPVAAMWGEWQFEPHGDGGTLVRLLHHFRAVDDTPATLRWIERALDANSAKELGSLRDAAERGDERRRAMLTFEDTVRIEAPAAEVYDFLYAAQGWPERLPHVARVSLREDTPNVQILEMDTVTPDGHRHTTESIRICSPHSLIAYKQVRLPALLDLHAGRWIVHEYGGTTTVTSMHSVAVAPGAIPSVLGPEAGVPEALAYARQALGANSLTTLRRARELLERR